MEAGRPSAYNKKIADEICERIAGGESPADAFGLPSRLSVCGIYALLHPDTLEVRYIGQSKNIRKRFNGHCCSNSNLPVSSWIRSLSGKPKVIIIEETTEIDSAEIKWISAFRKNGFRLLNISDGEAGYSDMSSSKNKMPWSGKLAPIQKVTSNLSRLATEMRKSGNIDGSIKMKKSADECRNISRRIQGAGRDSWIEANKALVVSRGHLREQYPDFEGW